MSKKTKKGAFGGSPTRTEIITTTNIKVNFWGMVRDVCIHAMNRGQLIALALATILVLLVWKAPADQVIPIIQAILQRLRKGEGLGYILLIFCLLAWAVHARWQRSSIAGEMNRIGREKTRLQEQTTRRKLSNPLKGNTP
ncbi:MAG: hypothetical protein HZA93_24165 [Verrucomicrobia bacterium]|nr:hypothetical protein [Verrucomicrobiota bacterium]